MLFSGIHIGGQHHGESCYYLRIYSPREYPEAGRSHCKSVWHPSFDATKQRSADLSAYDLIGFASGIDFGKFYEVVEQFLEKNLPENKRVFFLYTCARTSNRFTESVQTAARKKGAIILGEYGCRGFNTYGPWKMIGGMNKGHPSAEELQGAVRFFESLLQQ